ncbi:hypothetical protein [Halolamina sp.]|uniref:hypothetical protein n=1 Tax=Halolamina sp. TaxID=1940283 RepID=UPI003566B9D8
MEMQKLRNGEEFEFRRILIGRWVGIIFLLLLGGFVASLLVFHDPYVWPLIDLGRRTSLLLGCSTLGCVPFAWGIGILYMYLFAVLLNALRQTVNAD